MRHSLLLLLFLIGLTECQSPSGASPEALTAVMHSDTVLPEAYRLALSTIHANLEKLTTQQAQLRVEKGDLSGNALERINADIQQINLLLDSNRAAIRRLNRALRKEKQVQANMQVLIDNMNDRLLEKEEELTAAREALEEYDVEVLYLHATTGQLNATLEAAKQKNARYEKGWYALGSEKILVENNVITREGGFLGMGKTTKINQVLNKKKFREVMIYKTTEIPVQSVSARLITPHDPESYEWVKERGQIMSLVIKNPERFWSISRYLVIIAE